MEEMEQNQNTKKFDWTHLLRPIIFVAIFLAIFFVISAVFAHIGDTRMNRIEGYKLENENSLQVVAIGDSNIYSGYSPAVVYKEFGLRTYNCGQSNQNLDETYDILADFCTNQKPSVLVLEVSCFFSSRTKKSKIEDFKDSFGGITYHQNWKNVDKFIANGFKKLYDNSSKGYVFSDKICPTSKTNYMSENNDKLTKTITKRDEKRLDRIIEFCNNKDIKILFIKTPNLLEWSQARHDGIQRIADKNNINFLDYNCIDFGFDFSKDFRDNGSHLNAFGTKKMSKNLGQFIVNNYTINSTQEGNFEEWNRAVDNFYNNI